MQPKPPEVDPEAVQTGPDTFEKPQTFLVGNPDAWRVANKPCPDGQHNFVKDESETEFDAMQCTKCDYGYLIGKKDE